tara:strand:+ start:296 stop:598 length:303 start_codon:yes stop_codon:yes gene_type:complete
MSDARKSGRRNFFKGAGTLKKQFIDLPKDTLLIPSRMLSALEKQRKKRDDALNRSTQPAKEQKPPTPPKNGVSDKKKLLDEAKRMKARRKMSRYDRGTKQ